MAINWKYDIAPMFTQYDIIKMKFMFDLANYNDVKANAEAILDSVSYVPPALPRMPLHEDPWTQAMIQTFKQWMDAGYLYSATSNEPPPLPEFEPLLPVFIALSEFLTGFDNIGQKSRLAQVYLTRLRTETTHGPSLDVLLQELKPYVPDPLALTAQIHSNPLVFIPPVPPATEAQLSDLACGIIVVWYTSTIRDTKGAYIFGTPQDNQYIEALIWPAVQAEPMAYSEKDYGYWEKPPSDTE
jgi:hypothetical protein